MFAVYCNSCVFESVEPKSYHGPYRTTKFWMICDGRFTNHPHAMELVWFYGAVIVVRVGGWKWTLSLVIWLSSGCEYLCFVKDQVSADIRVELRYCLFGGVGVVRSHVWQNTNFFHEGIGRRVSCPLFWLPPRNLQGGDRVGQIKASRLGDVSLSGPIGSLIPSLPCDGRRFVPAITYCSGASSHFARCSR